MIKLKSLIVEQKEKQKIHKLVSNWKNKKAQEYASLLIDKYGEPNVKGGSIVYDLGNGEYIYQSPVGFELVRDGVYTSLGSGYANLQDLLNSNHSNFINTEYLL